MDARERSKFFFFSLLEIDQNKLYKIYKTFKKPFKKEFEKNLKI